MDYCPKCSTNLNIQEKFCSNCGLNLSLPYISSQGIKKAIPFLILLTGGFWFAVDKMTKNLAGKKPDVVYSRGSNGVEASARSQGSPHAVGKSSDVLTNLISNDPEIENLRSQTKADPKNIEAWRRLADILEKKYFENPTESREIAFDLIEALQAILTVSPNDKSALLAMASVAFDSQVFDKSVQFYERYLAQEPSDNLARAKYASTLTFVGKFEQAEKELLNVLSKDPKNFHALAYLSINHAQLGQIDQALKIGNDAILNAPSPEAAKRFEEFLSKIKLSKDADKLIIDESTNKSQKNNGVIDFIKNHAIAGEKFVSHELDGSVLTIYFKNFPMNNMPEFARTSFIEKLKKATTDDATLKINKLLLKIEQTIKQ